MFKRMEIRLGDLEKKMEESVKIQGRSNELRELENTMRNEKQWRTWKSSQWEEKKGREREEE